MYETSFSVLSSRRLSSTRVQTRPVEIPVVTEILSPLFLLLRGQPGSGVPWSSPSLPRPLLPSEVFTQSLSPGVVCFRLDRDHPFPQRVNETRITLDCVPVMKEVDETPRPNSLVPDTEGLSISPSNPLHPPAYHLGYLGKRTEDKDSHGVGVSSRSRSVVRECRQAMLRV